MEIKMLRKLRLDGLRAELSLVQELLRQSLDAGDPVGELQYEHRRNIITKEIKELEETVTTSASVTLFFGGRPVLGSKGIAAEFAGGALEKFQDLVTKTFAKAEIGQLGKRGPIPQKNNTQLMVTELARGSFGFVLDEMSDQTELQETVLKLMVDEVTKIVEKTGSPNESDFEEIIDSLDSRTLLGLKDFFAILDNNEATIRIVDDERDFILDKDAVHRGRLRTEATSIEEKEDFKSGEILGFLPEHKKFELKTADKEIIYGSVTNEAAEQYKAMVSEGFDIVGRHWKIKLTVRTVKPLNRSPKEVYRLIEFLSEIKDDV
jgi:hypothetical protein